MGSLTFEGKQYEFNWVSIIIMFIFGPIFSFLIYYSNDYVWLHEITARITVWSLNILTGTDNHVMWAVSSTDIGLPYYSNFEPGWFIIIEGREDGPIRFTTFCTGIQAIAIFVGVILVIPHSTIKKTSEDIWVRKIKAIIACSFLFYVVNIMRMWLQLYLYQIGYEWDDIHYSISAASSFIAIAAILLMNKYVPEFIMSLLWIGDQIRATIRKQKQLNSLNSQAHSQEDQKPSEVQQPIEKNDQKIK